MNRKLGMIIAAGLIAGVSLFVAGCEMCCNSSKGSGSMVITDNTTKETHKATFSYRVECVGSYEDPDTNPNAVRKVSGKVEYQDHGLWKNKDNKLVTVRIHASVDNVVDGDELAAELLALQGTGETYYDYMPVPDIFSTDPTEFMYCSKRLPNLAVFRGKYFPQPKSLGDGGVATIMVMDNGKPGPSADDRFEIRLKGGAFDGYMQRGILAKGDVKAL